MCVGGTGSVQRRSTNPNLSMVACTARQGIAQRCPERGLWIAEPSLGSDPRFEFAPVPELNLTIKGDGFSGRLGKGLHYAHQLVHQMRRAAIVVAEQDGEAGFRSTREATFVLP